jgi:hypothetical protein
MNHDLGGRKEKRLPIAIVVRLSRMHNLPANEEEKTYTDNVSPHGARVFSRRVWKPGEQVQVTNVKEGSSILGEVIYCHRLDNDHTYIGLKFHEHPVTWPAFSRYYRM